MKERPQVLALKREIAEGIQRLQRSAADLSRLISVTRGSVDPDSYDDRRLLEAIYEAIARIEDSERTKREQIKRGSRQPREIA